MVRLAIFILGISLLSCYQEPPMSSIDPVNWVAKKYPYTISDSLLSGTSYLSVYSHIYSETEHRTHPLTATVSLRNTSQNDTLILTKATYYNTQGELLREYFKNPIFLTPLETVEIVIDQEDKSGGSGANFIFDWKLPSTSPEPLFEAVMISTYGQQGLSFTTVGKKIK